METMTPRKQDSQAAVVQNLTSDRLLVSILAEKAGDRRGETAIEQNAEEQWGKVWVPLITL